MEQEKIDQVVCANCWDIVLGIHKTKDAEFYGINFKQFCSLSCYGEYEKKVQDEALKAQDSNKADQDNKRSKKVQPKRKKSKKK